MEYNIRKRVNAKSLSDAIAKEKLGEIVSVWMESERDYEVGVERKIGYEQRE